MIPRASTEALFAHFKSGVARLSILERTGHNTISDSPEYIGRLRATLDPVPSGTAP